MLLEDVQVEEFDAIIFTCDNDITFGSALAETNRIVHDAIGQGKLLAAICSAPRVLAYADAVAGMTVTGEPSQTCQMLIEAGADCTGERVEVDGLVITARDRYASRDFSQAVLDTLQAQSSSPITGESSKDQIVFYSERDGNSEIYIMNADGSDPRRLTFNQFEDSSPVWSPDGSQIAFLSDRDDPEPGNCFPNCFYQLYVINPDGGNEHKLIETDFSTLHPDWHPEGGRLSFDSEFNLAGDIYVLNSDGSSLELLIEDGFWADWSPDGYQLVFASNRDGNVEIYVANADGSNQQRLTENEKLDFFPAWSPNGSKIAFSNFDDNQIYIMDADGSNEQQLTFNGLNEDPAWSPDGTHIAFQSTRDGNFEIYTLNVAAVQGRNEGADPIRLTNNNTGDFWPSWGPEIVVSETIHLDDFEQAGDLQITIIYDNTAYDEALTPEWGFAALIEYYGHTVLFDTGGTSATFMNNLSALEIDPMKVDAVVISHAHGDHTGGLLDFLVEADQPTIYLPANFPTAFKARVMEDAEVIDVTTSLEIYPGIYSTGQLSADGLFEQGLVIDLGDEIVIVTGCAHPGIVNMVRRGRNSVPKASNGESKPVALVLGGFHLFEASRSQVEDVIAELRALDVRQVNPTHCTGDAAIQIFAELLGADYIMGGAGQIITLPEK
jgi:metal-dependent hydrolase (beta-lactamase superfamily II)